MKFNKILTIMLSFILVIIISATAVTAQSAAYYPKDVAPGHWAYKSICNVGKSGLMIGRGTPNGVVFDPNGTITGAEMFMTMYRLAGMPTEIPNLDFEITLDYVTWYSDAYVWCMYNGLAYTQYILWGSEPSWWMGDEPIYSSYVSDGRIGSTVCPVDPKGSVFGIYDDRETNTATRTDVVLLLYYYVTTYLGINVTESADLSVFSDYDLEKVKPNESGHTAVSFCNTYVGHSYSDEIVPAWEWAVGSGIIKGCGDGTLQMGAFDTEPKARRYVTRAEYAVILDRFMTYLENMK